MDAQVLHGIGDLRFEQVKRPAPAAGEVLVRVMAAGICGSDVPRVYRTGAHRMPLIPGHEFAGEVTELGTGVEPKWLHQRVGVFPLIPCGQCPCCQKKQYEMCSRYDYLGSRRDGGFTQYVTVPVWNLLPLPDAVGYEAAAMLEPMSVAVHAMRRADLQKDDTVAVCGLGTIGQLLAMFLKESGVKKILAIGNKEFQKTLLLRQGLPPENYCDSKRQDALKWLQERTDGNGADVFFECVGKNETLAQGIEGAAPMGRIVTVGNPYSDMQLDKDIYWRILRRQLRITGTWNSSFTHDAKDDWHYALDRLAKGTITPEALVSHRYPLENLEQGLRLMRDKSEDYIKIMMEIKS